MNKKMLFVLIILIGLLVSGCVGTSEKLNYAPNSTDGILIYNHDGMQEITRIHDTQAKATCWMLISGKFTLSPAISCIPDRELNST